MLTSKERAILRSAANELTPVFQLGKEEIDDAVIKATLDCLAVRELIKLKVLETSPYSTKEAAALLAEKTGSESVQVIGSKFVLYKEKPEDSKYAELLHPGAGSKKSATSAGNTAKKRVSGTTRRTGINHSSGAQKRVGDKRRGPAAKGGDDRRTGAAKRTSAANPRSFTARGTIETGARAVTAKRFTTAKRSPAKSGRNRTQ